MLWEIWNEPNGNFWTPKPDAQQYTALALGHRQSDPRGGAAGDDHRPRLVRFPWEFLETFLKSGVLEYLDAVSVHPYRNPHSPPETAAGDYQKLRTLIERYAPPPRTDKLPILSGEWGYSTWKHGVSLETQAAFAARQQLSNLLNGVPLSIWYDWKNDGPDPNENEHNFGTVLPDLTPETRLRGDSDADPRAVGLSHCAAHLPAERPGLRAALRRARRADRSWRPGRWAKPMWSGSRSSPKGQKQTSPR